MKKGKLGAAVLAIIMIIGLGCLFKCAEKVPAGYVGVVYSMSGGVEDEVFKQGWHIVPPTKDITLYSIGIEQSYLTAKNEGDSEDDDSFEVPSSDGKGLTVDLTFTYRYDEGKAADTFTRFKGQSGKEIKDSFIKPNVMSWTKEVTAKYPVTKILGEERANLNIMLTDYLKDKFEPYGIVIENAALTNINPDDTTRKAIQKKVNAQQKQEVANIEAKTARINAEKEKEVALIEAEKDKEVAQINSEKAKIKAEGEAEAIKVKAKAEAEANKAIAESLTGEVLDKIKYEKWDGSLPKITGENKLIIDSGDILNEDGKNQ